MGFFKKKNKGITININSDATMWYDKNNGKAPNDWQGRNVLGQFTKDTLGNKVRRSDLEEYEALKNKVKSNPVNKSFSISNCSINKSLD